MTEITTEELKFLKEIISKILEEYPELNFIIYPKREK